MASDLSLFLSELVRKPTRIYALAPSSTALAEMMVENISPQTHAVAELGAGTGRFTKAILDAGILPGNLVSYELNDKFRDLLVKRFPKVNFLNDAQQVGSAPIENVGAVISGLPLLSMPIEVQRNIVHGALKLLRPGGQFIQFTYGWKPSMAREVMIECDLVWEKSEKVWNNLPPARVYRYQRRVDIT